MEEKTIQVIYLVTDKYKNCAEQFISTMHFFMPGYKKHVTIGTDDPEMIFELAKKYCSEDISFKIHKMPGDCPYPCVNLSKFAYVKTFMVKGYDYVFYFDSDTYFIERPKYLWDKLRCLIDNKIVLAYHPAVMRGIIHPDQPDLLKLSYRLCDERPESRLYDKLGIKDEDFLWVITSFFAGTYDNMLNFATEANNKTKEAMKGPKLCNITEYYVPRLFDETVVNKMIYDAQENNDHTVNFYVDYFVINLEEYFDLFPNVMFIQKYDTETWNKNHD